ncbi:MAG: Crp/Fnr family transcriptional regulator [Cyanosarcina radialis HA8281-LM2]|jgi:CRP-like cAMP-binding protein|nr:Crp/Fnr family transcriptional regulator [Cyanosarcina radialis HA8281-LM2]
MPPTTPTLPTLELEKTEANEERRLHFYVRGEEIPLVTQGVWQVYRGMVQASTLCPNGEEALLGWVGSGSFFGKWLFHSQTIAGIHPHPESSLYASYRALSDVYLRWYAIDEIESSGALAQSIVPYLVKRIQQTESLLAIAGQRRVEDRLHQLLLLLKQEMGQSSPVGTRLEYRLTHQHLANAIGTTRVTITRILKKLQQEGTIAIDGDRHIILKDECFRLW